MKQLFFNLILAVGFTACLQKPTTSVEETVNIFKPNTVLADTRSAFLYTSWHVPGSVNLLSSDFLILKNAKEKVRIFDPDLDQTIERLAKKGIHPQRKVLLISETKNSDENKKWNWLLKNLGVDNVEFISVQDFKKKHPNARYSPSPSAEVWDPKLSTELQQVFIFKKAASCFVNWSEKICEN